MKHVSIGIASLGLFALACGSSSTSPSTPASTVPKFSAALSPANETPPVTNADSSGSGTATITLNTTKDATGAVTAATADFQVTLTGFPANTTLTGAHIHPGVAGVAGPVIVSTTLANGEVVLANGSGSFTKTGINVPADTAQLMLINPAGYYFNVHTTLNPGGAVRNQLVRNQ